MNSSIIKREEDFKRELEPLFLMLEAKGTTLSKGEWTNYVNAVKDRVVLAPNQFLSGFFNPDLPLRSVIDRIFEERLN